MEVLDFIVNRTDEFDKADPCVSRKYRKYFKMECNIALGLTALNFLTVDSPGYYVAFPLLILNAADAGIRGLRGNYGREPVSGLIGLTREGCSIIKEKYFSKQDKSH